MRFDKKCDKDFEAKFDKESLFLRALHSQNALKGTGDDGVILAKSNHSKVFTKSFGRVLDCAREFIIANDGFCEGIHFKREWLSLEQIAKKAMLVNISDIVAMNARPKYALASVVLPRLSAEEVVQIAAALSRTARDFGIKFIGGDTMSGGRLDFHITLFGVAQGKILTRKGLKKGDLIFCTNSAGSGVGQCLKSLRFLQRQKHIQNNAWQSTDNQKRAGEQNHAQNQTPNQQIAFSTKSKRFSRFVAPTLRAKFIKSIADFTHCGLDISDGVYAELNRLSALNHLGFSLASKISQKPLKSCKILPKNLQKNAYLSGEEYEMLFAISPRDKLALMRKSIQSRTPLFFVGIAKIQKTHFRAKIWH